MSMSSITTSRDLTAPKRAAARIVEIAQAIADQWNRAQKAQFLAKKYLGLSEEILIARGTSRDAVIDRIRRVMTDKV